jgi:hypothetical protein
MLTRIRSIKESLSLPVCSGWDRGFLESILEQVEKNRRLSTKQISLLDKVLARNTNESQREHEAWEQVFREEHAKEASLLATYYRTTGYFLNVANEILSGAVPERKAYLKMRQNKYATKVIDISNLPPKYNNGDYVLARSSFSSSKAIFDSKTKHDIPWSSSNEVVNKFLSRGAFIIESTDLIISAAAGAKTYKILPIGATMPFIVEERYIKIKR